MKNRIITLLCIVCLFTGNEVCRAQVQEVISGVVVDWIEVNPAKRPVSVAENPLLGVLTNSSP